MTRCSASNPCILTPLLPMAGTGEPGPARSRGLLDPPCSAPRDNVGSLADDDFAPRAGLTGLFTERMMADPIVNRPRPGSRCANARCMFPSVRPSVALDHQSPAACDYDTALFNGLEASPEKSVDRGQS